MPEGEEKKRKKKTGERAPRKPIAPHAIEFIDGVKHVGGKAVGNKKAKASEQASGSPPNGANADAAPAPAPRETPASPPPANSVRKEHEEEKGEGAKTSKANKGNKHEKASHKPAAPAPALAEDSSSSALPSIYKDLEARAEKAKQQADKLARELKERDRETQRLREELEDVAELNISLEGRLRDSEEEAEAARNAAPRAKFQKLDDPEYSSRFQLLVQKHYSITEAKEALDATAENGKYSVTRASAYLQANTDDARRQAIDAANLQAHQQAGEEAGMITDDSAIGQLLGQHTDATDILLKLRDAHAAAKARGAHTALPAVCAGNMVRSSAIANDKELTRKGHQFLSKAAFAVSLDCKTCGELRDKLEADEAAKARAAKAKAEAAEALKKRQREAREREEEREHRRLHGPVTVNFDPNDSRRDVKLPRGHCANPNCTKVWSKANAYLYYCDKCKRGYHLLCTSLLLVKQQGKEAFWCAPCMDDTERRTNKGEEGLMPTVIGSDIYRGKAPSKGEAILPPQEEHDELDARRSAQGGGGAALQTPASSVIVPHTGGHTQHAHENGFEAISRELDFGSKKPNVQGAKPTINVKDYVMWDVVPKDWKPKDGQPKEHPEKGYNKVAYLRWKRLNATQRDAVAAGGSTLGPLTRGVSSDMKIVLGTQLMSEPLLSEFWPTNPLTDASIDEWANRDPAFKWFEKVSDDVLLELLDKRFGVQKPDLFLSKRFPADLPTLNAEGEVNYHGAEFLRWSTDWQAELSELQRSKCSLVGVDLKQALLNALSTNQMLHNKCKVHTSNSIFVLLSHLRDWVLREEEAQEALRNQRQSLLGNQPQKLTQKVYGAGGDVLQGGNPENQPLGHPQNQHNAVALLTQMHNLVQQQQGQGGAAAPSSSKPLPAHLKPCGKNDELAKCQGCNNPWQRSKAIPCYNECKFVGHPEFNREYKEKPFPKRGQLTWKDFRTKHPDITPPAAFLAWEQREKDFQEKKNKYNKRPRDEPESGKTA